MAGQHFSAAEREAIWLAHDKKCAYTRELLDVGSLHIDHILPEILAADPAAFGQAKTALLLPDDFDLRGWENLLPCKPGSNLQKGPLILPDGPLHYFLGIAASKKARIESLLASIEKRQDSGRALVLLQRCLERGDLSPADVASMLEENANSPDEVFRLLEGMTFVGVSEILAVRKADIEDLKARPLRMGANDHIDGVTLTRNEHDKVHVTTCREYDAAIKAGYFAASTFDMKMSVVFEHQCGLLRALGATNTPTVSFVADPRVGIVDLHLMPFSMFPHVADQVTPPARDDCTYQDKVGDGTLVIRRLRQNALTIEEHEGMGQHLIEVARADFDGDGIEDILLFEYCYATHGTLGFGGVRLITRTDKISRFRYVGSAVV